jgi:UDP-N-acetyl-D-mannosaminuronic acid dehydrogenase
MKKVCVIGLGYTGLPTAAMFATHGCQVIGVDINPSIIDTISQGKVHIHEPGLPELVRDAVAAGNLTVSLKPEPADAFIIEVPTPFKEDSLAEVVRPGDQVGDKHADMSFVIAAAHSITEVLQKGNLVVLESTSPPRTTVDIILPILEETGLRAGLDFHLAYTPERVLPGRILQELVHNARVIGGIDAASARAGYELYNLFVTGEIVLTDATTAEMAKLMENTYRDVNIALANEFSRLADRFGVNIWESISIANKHPRVKILNPSPGVGGHCISVDPWFLVEAAPDLSSLIRMARHVNDDQPVYVCGQVTACLGDLQGKSIAALGLAYKPDVDDLRESPAIETVKQLQHHGARVIAYDPYKPEPGLPGIETTPNLEVALKGADLILILVAHSQFRALDPQTVRKMTGTRRVFDAVNAWSGDRWELHGFTVYHLGDGKNHARV